MLKDPSNEFTADVNARNVFLPISFLDLKFPYLWQIKEEFKEITLILHGFQECCTYHAQDNCVYSGKEKSVTAGGDKFP